MSGPLKILRKGDYFKKLLYSNLVDENHIIVIATNLL